MPNLWTRLFRRSDEIQRFSLDEWMRMASQNRWGFGPTWGGATTYAGGKPSERVENSFSGYVWAGYKQNPIVFGIIKARSDIFSEARFIWRKVADGRPGDLFWDSALGVLAKPWPNGTTGELLTRMIQDVDLAGNFYAVRDGQRLRRLRPDWVQIVLSGDPRVDVEVDVVGYLYTPGSEAGGDGQVYLPDEVCHWSPIPDPDAMYRGMSWVTPVVREIEGDKAATDHKLAFFANGATLGPIIKAPAGISVAQFKEFIEASNAAHQGTSNAYRPMYVGGGADVTLGQATMQQIDFKSLTGSAETRMCVAARLPAVLAGVSEGLQGSSLNAGNYNAAKRSFVDGTLRSLWRSACAALATIVDVPEDAELWWDERDIAYLREDMQDLAQIQQTQAATLASHIAAGWTPETALQAVTTDDLSVMQHSGMMSVQLQPPGAPGEPGADPAAAQDAAADEYQQALEEFRADLSWANEVVRKFDPSQLRDHRGRWALTAATIAAFKAQGGEQGGTYFDDGRHFDWSTFHATTQTYDFEVGDGEDAVSFEVGDYDLEQFFNALSVTRLRDSTDPDSHSPALAALARLGHADHIVFEDGASIDWSTRTESGDYGFGVENGDEFVEFDLSPAEMDKLIASLALSTQATEAVNAARSYVTRFDPSELRVEGGEHGGEWTSGGVLKDVLKLAGKIDLADGETLAGSDKLSADNGSIRLAAVDHGGKRSLRLGIGDQFFGGRDDEAGPWRAGRGDSAAENARRAPLRAEMEALESAPDSPENDKRYAELSDMDLGEVYASGYTASLDAPAAAKLMTTLRDALAAGKERQAEFDTDDAEMDRLDNLFSEATPEQWEAVNEQYQALKAKRDHGGDYDVFAEGVIAGDWADVHYQVLLDDPDVGVQTILSAVPHGMKDVGDEHANLDPAEAAKLVRLLAKMSGLEASRSMLLRADYYNIRVDAGLKGGGRFRRISDVIADALTGWLDGKGDRDADPLEPFLHGSDATVKARLRKASKDLGVEPAPRASIEELKLGLLKDARARYQASHGRPHPSEHGAEPVKAPAKRAPRKAAPTKAVPPLTGRVAQDSAPVRWDYNSRSITASPDDWSDAEREQASKTLSNWVYDKVSYDRARAGESTESNPESKVNAALRGTAPMTPEIARDIETLDRILSDSKLPAPVTAYRGFTGSKGILPEGWQDRDLVGLTWDNDAFTSVTVDQDAAEAYSGYPEDGGFALRVHLPAGMSALSIQDASNGPEDEGEMVLPRGMTFRVTKDNGIQGDYGIRWLDVKVIEATPRTRATKRTPAKAAPSGAEPRRLTAVEADSLSTAQFSSDGAVVTSNTRTRANLERVGLVDDQGRITATGRAALAAHQNTSAFDAEDSARELFALRDDPGSLREALEGRSRTQLRAIFRVLNLPEPGSSASSTGARYKLPPASERAEAPALRDALVQMLTHGRPSSEDNGQVKAPGKAAPPVPTPPKRTAKALDPDATLTDLRGMDRESARDALDLHTIPQLKALMPAGMPKSGKKRELVDRLTEHLHPVDEPTVDEKLAVWDSLTPDVRGIWLRKGLGPEDVSARDVRQARSEGRLTDHLHPDDDDHTPGTPEARAAEPVTAPEPTPAGAIRPGQYSSKPILENQWGAGRGGKVAYHDDGPIGMAVKAMGQDQRLDVDGEPLANVIGEIATESVHGQIDTNEMLDQLRTLRDRLPVGSRARDELSGAIDDVDSPPRPPLDMPSSTPTPMVALMDALSRNPLARQDRRGDGGSEMDELAAIAEDFEAGRVSGLRLITAVRQLSNRRHESYGAEGKMELDRDVIAAADQLQALYKADRESLRPRARAEVSGGVEVPKADGGQGSLSGTGVLTLLPPAQRGRSGDEYVPATDGSYVWGPYGSSGVLFRHVGADGQPRYLLVQRGPGIDNPGKWQFPGGARDEHETAAQGAAREAMEELGVSEAQLAAANVHGAHVYQGPGDWTYTSIAADVQEAFTPDLGGRTWETSDARWLTAAEIRELDSRGELHSPLAKGALEGNVVSLFPEVAAPAAAQPARPDTRWRPTGVTAADEQALRAALKSRRPTTGMPGASDMDYVEKLANENNSERLLGQFVERHPELRARGGEQAKQILAAKAKAAFASRPVAIGITPKALEAVLREGRFKTQLETGTSRGVYQPEDRIRREREWFGVPRDADPADRPIYGYLASKTSGPKGLVAMYGDVQVVLKDDVRSRTTAMVGDSMGHIAEGAPSSVDDPDWRAFTPASDDHAHLPIGKLDRDYDGAAFTRNDYIEAQVHGGVTADDIAEVVLSSQPSPELRTLLEERGIAWRTRRSNR